MEKPQKIFLGFLLLIVINSHTVKKIDMMHYKRKEKSLLAPTLWLIPTLIDKHKMYFKECCL